MGKPNMGLDFTYYLCNANFVNNYGYFGTTSIFMERFNLETSYLAGLFT